MTTIALRPGIGADRTGAFLGDRIGFVTDDASRVVHSQLQYELVEDPVLREMLPVWEESLPTHIIDPAFEHGRGLLDLATTGARAVLRVAGETIIGAAASWLLPAPQARSDTPAYDAVRYIQETLRVPVHDVLIASGIAPRTFYAWRSERVRKTRLGSEGKLWKLLQVVEDLQAVLGTDLHQWMRDQGRRQTLRNGDVDQILAVALIEESSRSGPAKGPVYSSAVGNEVQVPRLATPGTRRAQRGPIGTSRRREPLE